MLVKVAERWVRSMGCAEIGSDVELPNTASQQFHARIGFHEANRLVSYIKQVAPSKTPRSGWEKLLLAHRWKKNPAQGFDDRLQAKQLDVAQYDAR